MGKPPCDPRLDAGGYLACASCGWSYPQPFAFRGTQGFSELTLAYLIRSLHLIVSAITAHMAEQTLPRRTRVLERIQIHSASLNIGGDERHGVHPIQSVTFTRPDNAVPVETERALRQRVGWRRG